MAGVFDRVRDRGTPLRSIALQTRRGRDIPNHIPDAPTVVQLTHESFIHNHPNWRERTPPNWNHNYNCAGHIWASRRVFVECEHDDLQQIFEDDGYRIIQHDEVQLGDLALYYDTPTHTDSVQPNTRPQPKSFLHVGRVVGVGEGTHGLRQVFILSKWGLPVGEAYHAVQDHPFEDTATVVFWTERLAGAPHAPQHPRFY